ncbi:MAG: heme ABC exporter ATP-binding protein CcmA [Pseudomonadota bacterium]
MSTELDFIRGYNLGAVRGERILFGSLGVTLKSKDIVFLRGQNGAGKTTLLRQLAGLSQPQSGHIQRNKSHHWIGHTNGLKAHETPRKHLQHWARVWGSSANIDLVLKLMGLERPADVPVALLSAGQKRRTALSRLFLSDREIWLLDEPFNALDTDGQSILADMIKQHSKSGGAVIAALHGDAPIKANLEIVL